MKTKDIRLQDTLAFVGINDESRLDALKRHIVRNPNIGVASFDRPFRGYSLKFLILNEQLSTVETKWTVAKLAQTIAEKAGIVRLTYGRAASIIASCRGNTAEIPATDRPADDQQLPTNFLTCLLGKEKGVGSAGISDPTGREYYYEIIDPDAVRRGIYTTRWTYQDLIKHIADEAHIPGLLRAYGGN